MRLVCGLTVNVRLSNSWYVYQLTATDELGAWQPPRYAINWRYIEKYLECTKHKFSPAEDFEDRVLLYSL